MKSLSLNSQLEEIKMNFIILAIVLSLMVAETIQQVPSINCVQDNNILLGSVYYQIQSPLYSRSQRLKCTLSNINAFEQINKAMSNARQITYTTANIVALTFNQSNLSSFPGGAFSTYANLRSMDGSNLRLTDLSSGIFSGLKSLDLLVLSFNNLTALSSKVFGNMKLKLLDLSYNLISTIDENAFLGTEIDKIDLSFNKLKTTKFINALKFFDYLQMGNNQIEKFEAIDIKEWGGQASLFQLPKYPSISLQSNKIKSFDCSSSIELALIDFTNNRDLKIVTLNTCKISQFDVSDCGSLKSIKLTDNLSEFTAKNVKFEQIDFGEKNSLESLTLVNNSLSFDVIASISKSENLTYLELSYNNIGPLNISTFAKLKKLITLKLKATNISNISFGTFSHQNNIREFDISDNNLENFDLNMIYTMHSLSSLDISGNALNELVNLDAAHLTFSVLEKIDLTNNKFSCVYLMRLIKIMKTYRVVLVNSNIEEHQSNINGIYCVHVEGEDSVIVPLAVENSNFTEFREKLNEVIGGLSKVRESVATLQKRSEIQAKASELKSSPPSNNENALTGKFQVQNSAMLDFTLTVVCACVSVFIALQIFVVIKKNFLNRPRPIRGISEHTLNMNDDY